MGTLPYCLFTLCILLGFINGFVYSDTPGGLSAVVVGQTECLDCAHKNIKAENAFDGLRVAIKCKVQDGMYETKAVGKLDAGGSFKVKLPAAELLHDGGSLKHESCFAQLHGAADEGSNPCLELSDPLVGVALRRRRCHEYLLQIAHHLLDLPFSCVTPASDSGDEKRAKGGFGCNLKTGSSPGFRF